MSSTPPPSPPPRPESRDQAPAPLVQSPERLAAVWRARVLGAPRDGAFDAVTRLAARLAGVPASFVSIVDADHDFYLSESGFTGEMAATRRATGRTFCHYTLSSEEPLVIADTHAHPLWRAVPTVDSMGVRAYVGVPLKVDGMQIGSLCVIDRQPRDWQPADVEILQQLAASVEREIQLRMAVEKAQTEAAYGINMARSREYAATALAHDLRTPLQILQLGMAVLKRITSDPDHAVFRRMSGAVQSMKGMADALLTDTSAAPEAMMMKREVTALELAADATGMMTPIAERAGIVLTLGEFSDAVVRVEYAQMLRALGNLIGNAIKYSPPESRIVVSGSRQGQTIRIEVTDQGQGMSEQDLSHAFDRGYQGGDGMVRGDGAGLGLSIVRHLAEQNGGSVDLQSQLGRGTVATIALPCIDAA